MLLLAEHFLPRYAAAHGLAAEAARPTTRAPGCARYPWPGNVRELGHLMERVTLLATPSDDRRRRTLAALAHGARRDRAGTRRAARRAAGDDGDGRRGATHPRRAGARRRQRRRAPRALLGLGRNALRYRMRRLGIDARRRRCAAGAGRRRGRRTGRAAGRRRRPPPPARGSRSRSRCWPLAHASRPTDEHAGYEPWTAATRWERAIAERVEGFGGVFVQRTPSRCTAVFGVPRALEQTPQRAVQAALAIQRAAAHGGAARGRSCAPPCTSARCASTPRRADPLARLLPDRRRASPCPSACSVTPAPARCWCRRRRRGASSAASSCEPRALQLGPARRDRLTAHAVAAAAAARRPQPRRREAPPTRFVGRERELDLLRDAFARAAAGHGQVVFVAGEAGIGKSRLLAEFRRRLAGQPHRWIEGRCASYGTTTPFLPLIDGLRRYLGIDDRDDEAQRQRQDRRARSARLGADLAWTLPFIQQLLSLPVGDDAVRALDSASRRSELFRALRALTLRAAELEPLVLVVEDLHWIDPASEECLAFLADVDPDDARRCSCSRTAPATAIRSPTAATTCASRLAPLSGADMAAMTGSLLGHGARCRTTLRALIAGKAEGNPFFVEELVRSLLEDGALRREDGAHRAGARARRADACPTRSRTC